MLDDLDSQSEIIGLYLWLLFGYLSSMVTCDLQKLMKDNILFRHFIGIVSFFFLFTIHNSNNCHIIILLQKTILIYFIFLVMIKSKLYFALPVLFLLIIDQIIKYHKEYLYKKNKLDKSIKKYEYLRIIINKIIKFLIIIGFLDYVILQYLEFGNDFLLYKLIFFNNCKN